MKLLHYGLLLCPLLFSQPVLAQRGGPDQVRIAHAQDFPPLAEIKDGKSEGLAVEILNAAAARSALQVKFVAVPFEQVHTTLQSRIADHRAPRSEQTVRWPATPNPLDRALKVTSMFAQPVEVRV